MDTPAANRNLMGLMENDRDFLRRGIRLRQFGQRIIELIGGKRIHPGGWSGPGGVHTRFTAEHRAEILPWIPEAIESITIAADRLKRVLDSFRREIEHIGQFSFSLSGDSKPGERA